MTDVALMSDYDLSQNNTMALSSTAQYAILLEDVSRLHDDVINAIKIAKARDVPLFVLSAGSNVILPSILEALVLLPRIQGIEIIDEDDARVTLRVAAGEVWHDFVKTCLDKGYFGLENLALIPGLVGACPVQNIGAYGVQVSDFIEKVIAIDLFDGREIEFDNHACAFDYRHSFFKDHPNRYLISHVVFKLHKCKDKVLTSYGDLAQVASQEAERAGRAQITPLDVFHAVIAIRQSKLPDPSVLPNCGSFFQNPIIPMCEFERLKQVFDDLPSYPVNDEFIKIPAGWLIDRAGLKGQGVFPILTHQKQALVLTNHAPYVATQADIERAQDFIINTVQEKFGVALVREPVWVNGSIL